MEVKRVSPEEGQEHQRQRVSHERPSQMTE